MLVGLGCAINTPRPYQYIDDKPAYSPDGSKIAFVSQRITSENPQAVEKIWLMEADGSNQRCLLRTPCIGSPTWSPDSQTVMLLAHTKRANLLDWRDTYDLLFLDLSGKVIRRVALPDSRSGPVCVHPDGKRLIWIGDSSLWFTNLEGAQRERICDFGKYMCPSGDWSRAIFSKRVLRTEYLFAVDVSRRCVRQLKAIHSRSRIELSPDGNLIVYRPLGSSDIHVMTFEGTMDRRLVARRGQYRPSPWSWPTFPPGDSSRLIYYYYGSPRDRDSAGKTPWGLRIIDTNGVELKNLVFPHDSKPHTGRALQLSPDGKHILYVGGPRLSWGLYLADLDTGGVERLSPATRSGTPPS
jgi:Tol biopolymer transport system component